MRSSARTALVALRAAQAAGRTGVDSAAPVCAALQACLPPSVLQHNATGAVAHAAPAWLLPAYARPFFNGRFPSGPALLSHRNLPLVSGHTAALPHPSAVFGNATSVDLASSVGGYPADSRRAYAAKGTEGMDPALLSRARRIAAAVGLVAGGFGSLVGVGGGVLIAPVIINACKTIPQRVVSGTSLAAVATTGSIAGYIYAGSGLVDLPSAAILMFGAMLTAPLGARATHVFDCAMLRKILASWLYLVSPIIPLKALYFSQQAGGGAPAAGAVAGVVAAADASTSAIADTAITAGASAVAASAADAAGAAVGDNAFSTAAAALVERLLDPSLVDAGIAATGLIAGFASGLLGIGGGTIVTPLLAVFSGMPQGAVLGTSLCAMVVPSVVGLVQHSRLGNVDWKMAAGLAAGTLAGGALGSSFAVTAPPGVLEAAFSLGMLYLGRKTMQSAKSAAAAAAAAKAAAAGKK